MASKVNSFKKEERLCNVKYLEILYASGSSFLVYPFRVVFIHSPSNSKSFPVQVVMVAPKKRYKSAVDRNLIKRRSKEAYRLNKEAQLYPTLLQHNKSILLSLSYIGKEIHDFNFIQQKMLLVFKTLLKQLEG